MTNIIKKACAAALLAATTYAVYTCVQLEREWTRLAEDGNEIRKIQDGWSLLSLGKDVPLDEAVQREIQNNPQKGIIAQNIDELSAREAILRDRKPYSSDEDVRLEAALGGIQEKTTALSQTDTQQFGRLRFLMDYEG